MKTTIEISDSLRSHVEEYLRLEEMMAANKKTHRDLMELVRERGFDTASERRESLRLGIMTSGLFHQMAQVAQCIGEQVVGEWTSESSNPQEE